MPRLTAKMAEKIDEEIRAYWQKQHEIIVERRRELEKTWTALRKKREKGPQTNCKIDARFFCSFAPLSILFFFVA